ncbi:hypothetical protein D3C76_1303170 [compost metagenome]
MPWDLKGLKDQVLRRPHWPKHRTGIHGLPVTQQPSGFFSRVDELRKIVADVALVDMDVLKDGAEKSTALHGAIGVVRDLAGTLTFNKPLVYPCATASPRVRCGAHLERR